MSHFFFKYLIFILISMEIEVKQLYYYVPKGQSGIKTYNKEKYHSKFHINFITNYFNQLYILF